MSETKAALPELETSEVETRIERLRKKSVIKLRRGEYNLAVHATGERPHIIRADPDDNYIVQMSSLSSAFIDELRQNTTLSGEAKAQLNEVDTLTADEAFSRKVASPSELGWYLGILCRMEELQLEMKIGDTWYPMPISVRTSYFFKMDFCMIEATYIVGDDDGNAFYEVSDIVFRSSSGGRVERTVEDVLNEVGLRRTTPERLQDFRRKLLKLSENEAKNGTPVMLTDNVLFLISVGWRTVLRPCYLPTPIMGILEAELEASKPERGQYRLPILRVFSMAHKDYGYIDVDKIKPYEYDEKARDRVVLPPSMKKTLDAVFTNKVSTGDLFKNRHGGIIILATGDPGVGKTLTAEAYAEYTHRPLYTMDIGELGSTVASVESELDTILERARRWNAVLLMDEADIFLTQRNDQDLERSAIVGVFLRILDRYEGTLFLTTNRPDSLDFALRSRVTVMLKYPNLVRESRGQIWGLLLAAAHIELTSDAWGHVLETPLNGRNIRNAVKVFELLFKDQKTLNLAQVQEALQFIST